MIYVNSKIFDCPAASQALVEQNLSLALSCQMIHMQMLCESSFGQQVLEAVAKYRDQHRLEVADILVTTHQIVEWRRFWASLPYMITSEAEFADPLSGQNLKPMIRWIDDGTCGDVGIKSPHAAYADGVFLSAMVPKPRDLFGAYVLFHEVGHCLWERHSPAIDLLTCVASETGAILYHRSRILSILPSHLHADFIKHEKGSAALTAKMMLWEWTDHPKIDQVIPLIQPALLHVPGYQIVTHLAEESAAHFGTEGMPKEASIMETCRYEIARFFSTL